MQSICLLRLVAAGRPYCCLMLYKLLLLAGENTLVSVEGKEMSAVLASKNDKLREQALTRKTGCCLPVRQMETTCNGDDHVGLN